MSIEVEMSRIGSGGFNSKNKIVFKNKINKNSKRKESKPSVVNPAYYFDVEMASLSCNHPQSICCAREKSKGWSE